MKIYVVGIGPGNNNMMTPQAKDALSDSDVICGYGVYVDLVKDDFADKQFLTTPMKKEADRCRMAVEEALKGQTVSMVCSGDPGVYGMASLMYEVAQDYDPVDIEIVPGITAACSGAAVLGAPLIHDFAVISLSDLLTPWETIEKRLACAADGDFSICLYNPSSIKRHDYLRRACEILLKYRSETNAAGIVQNIGRDGESSKVMTLSELKEEQVDMFTTVFIGNSKTKLMNGKMITPRGYKL
ncbi:MAG: precorrin-3B C(17)-methyltransferase [Anaerofustis sp.]